MEGTSVSAFEDLGVRFEACALFQASPVDVAVCWCGWLDEDHGELAAVRVKRQQRRTRVSAPVRRAS